jgi:hypothetical protein
VSGFSGKYRIINMCGLGVGLGRGIGEANFRADLSDLKDDVPPVPPVPLTFCNAGTTDVFRAEEEGEMKRRQCWRLAVSGFSGKYRIINMCGLGVGLGSSGGDKRTDITDTNASRPTSPASSVESFQSSFPDPSTIRVFAFTRSQSCR